MIRRRQVRDPAALNLALALDSSADRGAERWQVCCPAHDDSTPSLSIGTGANGRTLVHCFAGCSQRAVLGALKRHSGLG